MTYIMYLLALLAVVYIGWSILKIRRLLIEAVALERENDNLTWWLRRYEGAQMGVKLTHPEKKIILNALEHPQYRELVTNPKTKHFIRETYNTLREKIKASQKVYKRAA